MYVRCTFLFIWNNYSREDELKVFYFLLYFLP